MKIIQIKVQKICNEKKKINENNLDGNFSSILFNNQSTINPQQRTKRNRTSFKHHQLRIMKTFFAQNHNPDSKGLKILSQKTQLSKRVLQVLSFIFVLS